MPSWVSPAVQTAGHVVTTAEWNELVNDLKIIGDDWTAYTPTLTAVTANPTMGTASVASGIYVKAGRLVIFEALIQFGTAGVAAGTGNYLLSLPFAAASPLLAFGMANVQAYLTDSSAGALAKPTPRHYNTDLTKIYMSYPAAWPSGADTVVGAAAPWVWAANDQLNYAGIYRAAS